MEDREIIALYNKRDERAVEETQRKYGRFCLSIARSILGSDEDAEESVNDACMNAWNSIPPHVPEVLPAFLGRLTRCASLKKWRDARAQKRGGGQTALVYEELSECVPGRETVESRVEAKELAGLINDFAAALPDAERMVFVRRYWYFDSVEDIARRFGFSVSKVKSMLFRGRNKLRSKLEKEGVFNED